MPNLIPAEDGIFDQHPEDTEVTGFSFDAAQDGELVEPRPSPE